MSTAHDLPLLNQILSSLRVVQERGGGQPHLADEMVADAILWRTGVLVRGVDRLSPDIVRRHPEVDWSALDRLHQVADGALGGLTRDEVWRTLSVVAEPLRIALEQEMTALHNPVAAEARARRVLLVDDDDDIRHILDLLLTHNGFAVVGAGNGVEALARAAEHAPDAVVADVQMPEMDGIELVKRFRGMPAMDRVPILLFTGKPPDDKLQHVLTLDRVRYMSKGDPRKIAAALEEMFDQAAPVSQPAMSGDR